MNYRDFIRDVPDFPKPGILFKDITPLLANPQAFAAVLEEMTTHISKWQFEKIVAVESRGFIFAAPLAQRLGVGFVPIRKPGKLPYKTVSEEYSLEYGSGKLEIHSDAVKSGERVLILDDILATGGTAKASCNLIEKLGGKVSGLVFFSELKFLNGRKLLQDYSVFSLVEY